MGWDELTSRVQDPSQRVFGFDAVYTQVPAGSTTSLRAIWSGEGLIVSAGATGNEIETTAPTVELQLSDMEFKPKQLDELQIKGKNYRIIAVQPDGQGMVALGLEVIS